MMDCESKQTLPYFALVTVAFLRPSALSHPRRQKAQPVHTCCSPLKSEGPGDRDPQPGFFLKTQVLSQCWAEYNTYALQDTHCSVAPVPASTSVQQRPKITNLQLYHYHDFIYQDLKSPHLNSEVGLLSTGCFHVLQLCGLKTT